MTLSQFRHILRAARAVSDCDYFMVFGSQAILGNMQNENDGYEFWKSRELDLAPLPFDQDVSDLVDGCLGELSAFDYAFGVYAHASPDYTPVFAANWESRAININVDGTTTLVPSFEDLALAKYIAGREKDYAFLAKMWANDLISYEKLLSLLPKYSTFNAPSFRPMSLS